MYDAAVARGLVLRERRFLLDDGDPTTRSRKSARCREADDAAADDDGVVLRSRYQAQDQAQDQALPSKRLVTEPSSKISRIARAMSGAIDSTVSLSNRLSSSSGSVLVMTTSQMRLFFSRSVAGSDSTPCVDMASTSAAPASNNASAALVIVPAVSIMSSTMMQVRPSTSPTTRLATTLLGTLMSRVL